MDHYLLQFFEYSHLPERLQLVSKPFGELAQLICAMPVNPERTTALRKLLESKDCAVRAVLFKDTCTEAMYIKEEMKHASENSFIYNP